MITFVIAKTWTKEQNQFGAKLCVKLRKIDFNTQGAELGIIKFIRRYQFLNNGDLQATIKQQGWSTFLYSVSILE